MTWFTITRQLSSLLLAATGGAINCALACESMMIDAQSFDLGSCYVGFGAMVKGNAYVVKALEQQ